MEKPAKQWTSVRLSPEAKRLWAALAAKLSISQTAWLEVVIRKEAKQEKVE